MSLMVLVPSRGRPESAARLKQAFKDTCTGATELFFVVDADDAHSADYLNVAGGGAYVLTIEHRGPRGTVFPLNIAARNAVQSVPYIGFMGDDHIPRTEGWDQQIMDTFALRKVGITYGNDLVMKEKLPTAVFMTSTIVEALGYMVPPVLHHLYADNFWKDLGKALGCLTYMPEVVIEHLHFSTGASALDETYQTANNPNIMHDYVAYQQYLNTGGLAEDVRKIKTYVLDSWL